MALATPTLIDVQALSSESLLDRVEMYGLDATRQLSDDHRSTHGQYTTPKSIAQMLASMFDVSKRHVRLLDPGAGLGMLTAAVIAQFLGRKKKDRPSSIHVVAYELEATFADYLAETLRLCEQVAAAADVAVTFEIRATDFIESAANELAGNLFGSAGTAAFDACILNPPYKKISSDSRTRESLRNASIETSNLYTAFVWLATRFLKDDGELVAITPRSFANGPYFRPFRHMLAASMSFQRLHIFDSRNKAFAADAVLQENIIYHLKKNVDRGPVTVTSSAGPGADETLRQVNHGDLIRDEDPDAFLHIVPDELAGLISEKMRNLPETLESLGLQVSTGRTVEFRAKDRTATDPKTKNAAPLIYPHHFKGGFVSWPATDDRINSLKKRGEDDNELLPTGHYVLVKRFSAKEEKKRIVAAVSDPSKLPGDVIAFENHLNYFHRNGEGLPPNLAKGLSLFLNSTPIDAYFRQFNGHTQVNARDLVSLRYPSAKDLSEVGSLINETFPSQEETDRIVKERLLPMSESGTDPFHAKQKIDEALAILQAVKTPKAQRNERSALTLLALVNVKPDTAWSGATDPRRGITEMMDYFRDHYGKTYAPNTRETVRRQTVHQFEQMGLILKNPDEPTRPPNSPSTVYQMEPGALELIRSFGSDAWEKKLLVYLDSIEGLNRLQEKTRSLSRIDVTLPDGQRLELTAGGQNVLAKEIVEQFCPRYTPGGHVIYLGDAGKKYLHFDKTYLAGLGVSVDEHGKMPDVVVHFKDKNWLILIEAVTSHGPVNLLRHNQLKDLFRGSKAGLVFVSTFLDRRAMKEYLGEISWETEVWCADTPDHLIHFNGERFLGPYGDSGKGV